MRQLVYPVALLLAAAPLAAQQGAAMQQSAQTSPMVGTMAPDFTTAIVDKSGAKATPFTLSKAKGQVVVLAFYPADFSSGCTAEMSKFRDEYKTLFGDGVMVLPISKDGIAKHQHWVDTMKFQFSLLSDSTGAVASMYGSNGARYFNRTVFVIDKSGKVVYEDMKFGALNQDAYDKLTAAVKAAKN